MLQRHTHGSDVLSEPQPAEMWAKSGLNVSCVNILPHTLMVLKQGQRSFPSGLRISFPLIPRRSIKKGRALARSKHCNFQLL